MSRKHRIVAGWSLMVAPFGLHAGLEATGKGWLMGVPEPLVDAAFATMMFVGFVLVVGFSFKRMATGRNK